MEIPRPAPGEELNPGEETVPRPAATVILLRGGGDALEVLLVQRNPESRFMGGAWVFPGGAVDRTRARARMRSARRRSASSTRRPASDSMTRPSWFRSRAGSHRRR